MPGRLDIAQSDVHSKYHPGDWFVRTDIGDDKSGCLARALALLGILSHVTLAGLPAAAQESALYLKCQWTATDNNRPNTYPGFDIFRIAPDHFSTWAPNAGTWYDLCANNYVCTWSVDQYTAMWVAPNTGAPLQIR